MDQQADELLRVYAKLTALRSNFASDEWVPVEIGREYDELVARAAKALATDFSEFMIGDGHYFSSGNKKFQLGNAVRSRLDGALNYIAYLMPREAKDRIGF